MIYEEVIAKALLRGFVLCLFFCWFVKKTAVEDGLNGRTATLARKPSSFRLRFAAFSKPIFPNRARQRHRYCKSINHYVRVSYSFLYAKAFFFVLNVRSLSPLVACPVVSPMTDMFGREKARHETG